MALGRGGAGSIPDYIGMSQDASKAGMNEAKSLTSMLSQGYKLGGQMADRTRRDQARTAIGQAFADGSPEAIDQAMQMFPEYAKQVQEMIGIKDDQHRKDVGSMTAQLHALIQSGNIDAAKSLVGQHANLFDKEGALSSSGIIKAMDDPKGLDGVDKWAQAATIGTLSPLEILKHYDSERGLDLREQGLENQLQLGQGRLSVAQGQLGLGQQRLAEAQNYHQQMLNRGTPGERDFEYFKSLPPDEQAKYLALHGKGGSGGGVISGLQKVQLTNGQSVDIDPKVHGSGAGAFYQGKDADGGLITVPINTVASPVSASDKAGQEGMTADLDKILNATGDDLGHITGAMRGGSTGKMPFGADTYTGMKGGSGRDLYTAANRIQGNMQNKGIAAAKEMGASGINTVAEAKMYFQSMPQLDYSSPEALLASANNIKDYTDTYNQKSNVKYKPSGGKSASELSDEELLKGL